MSGDEHHDDQQENNDRRNAEGPDPARRARRNFGIQPATGAAGEAGVFGHERLLDRGGLDPFDGFSGVTRCAVSRFCVMCSARSRAICR